MLLMLLAACSGDPEPTSVPVAPDGKPKLEVPAPPPQAEAPPASTVPSPGEWAATAPATFDAVFETTKGNFTIRVDRSWSPNGADRFYSLVKNGWYDDIAFFRNIDGFMVQFGIHGDPAYNSIWKEATILDDPVAQSNRRTFVSFATAGKDTRTTQVFINFGDNSSLDGMGFSPFGQVVEGMEVVDALYNGYGEGAPRGRGPDQGKLQKGGNAYLKAEFPKLDYIKQATITE